MRNSSPAIIGMFVALALGVAIAATALLAYVAGAPRVPDRLAHADLALLAPRALDGNDAHEERVPWTQQRAAWLAARLERIEGVTRAVPELSFYAQAVVAGRPVDGPAIGKSDPRGFSWSSHGFGSYKLLAGAAPGEGQVVAGRSAGVTTGARLQVLTAAGPSEFTVSGVTSGRGLYFTDTQAAKLAGGVKSIAIATKPGASSAQVTRQVAALGQVVSGQGRAVLEYPELGTIRFVAMHLLVANGSLAAFASVFVVSSTFALATAQRRREFALLRAVGATPGQVRRLVLRQALQVGAAAAAAGCVLAAVLSPMFGGLLQGMGMLPAEVSLGIEAGPLAVAFAMGLVAAVVGAWSAARKASRVPPLEAFRDAAADVRPMSRGRLAAGVSFLSLGVVAAVAAALVETEWQLITPIMAAMAMLTSLALLGPVVLKPVLALVPGMLVRQHALAGLRRTASMTTPIMITVGFVAVIGGLVFTMGSGGGAGPGVAEQLGAKTVVTTEQAPGLSEEVVAAVTRAAPRAVPLTRTMLYGPASGVPATGAPPSLVADGTMVINRRVAQAHGWKAGTSPLITFADGRSERIRVAAVVDGPMLSQVLIARATVRAHDPSALTSGIYVPQRLSYTGLGAVARSTDGYRDANQAEEDRQIWMVIAIMIVLSAGYTSVSIVTTLAMATTGRRRDLRVLRLSGATSAQVNRMLALETVLVVGVGAALGLVVAVPALLGVSSAMSVAVVIPWGLVGAVLAVSLALALAAVLLPRRG